MLKFSVIFFVISLIAAVFGFGGVASEAAGIGKILFYGFVLLTVLSLVVGLVRGKGKKGLPGV